MLNLNNDVMSRRYTIRFSENSALHIQEVARLYHVSISTVIKAMTMNSINAITDSEGRCMIASGEVRRESSELSERRDIKKPLHKSSVLEVIAKNYPRLKQLCDVTGLYLVDKEDDFSETILLLTEDEKVSKMSENEVLEYFKYRYNMVRFRSAQEKKVRKEIPYADNIQTKKEADREE